MGCLDQERLRKFVHLELSEEEAEPIFDHIDHCDICWDRLIGIQPPEGEAVEIPGATPLTDLELVHEASLEDFAEGVLAEAGFSLEAEISSTDAIPDLICASHSQSWDARMAALWALGRIASRMNTPKEEFLKRLIKCLLHRYVEDSNKHVRAVAQESLEKL